jgi:hypothetical protein
LTNLHFGRKLLGQIFIVKYWTRFHPETTDINYVTIMNSNLGF